MNKLNIRKIALVGILIALNVVFSTITKSWNFKISFSFLTIYVASYYLGVGSAMIVSAIGDLIGSLLFPTGPYYPAFTFTALLTGLIYGLIIKKNKDIKSICIGCLIDEVLVTLLLNTYFISLLFKADFFVLLSTRSIQFIIMSVVKIVVIKMISGRLTRFEKYFTNEL